MPGQWGSAAEGETPEHGTDEKERHSLYGVGDQVADHLQPAVQDADRERADHAVDTAMNTEIVADEQQHRQREREDHSGAGGMDETGTRVEAGLPAAAPHDPQVPHRGMDLAGAQAGVEADANCWREQALGTVVDDDPEVFRTNTMATENPSVERGRERAASTNPVAGVGGSEQHRSTGLSQKGWGCSGLAWLPGVYAPFVFLGSRSEKERVYVGVPPIPRTREDQRGDRLVVIAHPSTGFSAAAAVPPAAFAEAARAVADVNAAGWR